MYGVFFFTLPVQFTFPFFSWPILVRLLFFFLFFALVFSFSLLFFDMFTCSFAAFWHRYWHPICVCVRTEHTHTGVMATNRAATTFNIPNQQQNYTTTAHRTTQCIRIRSTILRHKWRQLGIKCFTNVSTVANFEAGAIYAKFTTTTIRHVTHNGQCCNIFLVTHSVYIYI